MRELERISGHAPRRRARFPSSRPATVQKSGVQNTKYGQENHERGQPEPATQRLPECSWSSPKTHGGCPYTAARSTGRGPRETRRGWPWRLNSFASADVVEHLVFDRLKSAQLVKDSAPNHQERARGQSVGRARDLRCRASQTSPYPPQATGKMMFSHDRDTLHQRKQAEEIEITPLPSRREP